MRNHFNAPFALRELLLNVNLAVTSMTSTPPQRDTSVAFRAAKGQKMANLFRAS
jgi:hypothetical protein